MTAVDTINLDSAHKADTGVLNIPLSFFIFTYILEPAKNEHL